MPSVAVAVAQAVPRKRVKGRRVRVPPATVAVGNVQDRKHSLRMRVRNRVHAVALEKKQRVTLRKRIMMVRRMTRGKMIKRGRSAVVPVKVVTHSPIHVLRSPTIRVVS